MIRSAFAEYQIALSGLTVAQANVQVSAHNIANSATAGYSRQYAQQQANNPYSAGSVGMWGTGASVTGVYQHRSAFLDTQYRSKNCVYGQYEVKNIQLGMTELTINALGEDGLTTQVDDYFDALQELSTNPESLTNRNNAISQAEIIVEQIGTIGSQLQAQQTSINQEIYSMVQSINSIGEQIASLNQQIKVSEANGSSANDLRDQRNLLIDELSKYVNVKVTETQKNKDYDPNDPTSGASDLEMSIQINGYNFVSGNTVNRLECVPRDNTNKVNEMDVDGLYDIQFANSGLTFDIYSSSLSGELKGLIDVRDGNNNIQTLVYDGALGKVVPSGTETYPKPSLSDRDASGNLLYTDSHDPAYIAALETYSDLDSSTYASLDDFILDVQNGAHGPNGSYTMESNNYKGLPHYMNKLNTFIRTFALSINEGMTFDTSNGYGANAEKVNIDGVSGHINAYDLNGNEGQLLFTFQSGGVYQTEGEITNYYSMNFTNLAVNPNLVDDPTLLACSDDPTDGVGNGNALSEIISLKDNTSIFKEGTYQDYLISMSGELGITKAQAESFENNYAEVVALTDNQRMSVSGVDLNEETINLTRNQQLYTASAMLISVLDTMYETCVNLGR